MATPFYYPNPSGMSSTRQSYQTEGGSSIKSLALAFGLENVPGEPPLLSELGIDFRGITKRVLCWN